VPDDPAVARQRRRLYAVGPGIRIPALASSPDVPPQPVVDVDFISMRSPPGAQLTDALNEGDFALLLASGGQVFYVDLDPVRRPFESGTEAPFFPLPRHAIRNGNAGTLDARGHGRPRVVANPVVSLPDVGIPYPARPSLRIALAPHAEGVLTSDPALQPQATGPSNGDFAAWAYFPRPSITQPQAWSVAWEDTLAGTTRSSGSYTPATATPARGVTGVWSDPGANFCDSDVRAGDIVALLGCSTDLDCGVKDTAVCLRPTTGAPGICLPNPPPPGAASACAPLLASRRRYEVARATKTALELRPLLDEIPRPSVAGCESDADCSSPSVEGAPVGFACRAVRAGEPKRCVVPCSTTPVDTCRQGFSCAPLADGIPLENGAAPMYCAEAPAELNPACLRETNAYRVQAGKSFVVTGSTAPRAPGAVVDAATGACVLPANRDPRLVNRIPLSAPACVGQPLLANDPNGVPTATMPVTEPLLKGATPPQPNPCLFRAPNSILTPGFPGFDDGVTLHTKALFENQDMRFVMTNLETYVGDSLLNGLTVTGGFVPLGIAPPTVEVGVAVPRRLLTGPLRIMNPPNDDQAQASFQYVFMIDAGRTNAGGNRGQVLRINPRSAFFYTNNTKVPFLIQ
jgi:hypothetical protein